MKKVVHLGRLVGQKPARRGANHRQRLENRRERRKSWLQESIKNLSVQKIGWLLLITLVVVGAGYGGWKGYQAYRDGRILTVNRIDVTGNQHWETSRLLERAGLEVGSHMPGVSTRSARATLMQLPGIQDVKVHGSLNGEISVEIKEEDVLALRHSNNADGWEGLTPTGAWMPLREVEGDLPVIEGDMQKSNTKALAIFLTGARVKYPNLFSGFSQIDVRSQDEADIYWRDGGVKVRIDYTNKSLNSLEFLQTLLQREKDAWAPGSTVDLRVEGYAYVL